MHCAEIAVLFVRSCLLAIAVVGVTTLWGDSTANFCKATSAVVGYAVQTCSIGRQYTVYKLYYGHFTPSISVVTFVIPKKQRLFCICIAIVCLHYLSPTPVQSAERKPRHRKSFEFTWRHCRSLSEKWNVPQFVYSIIPCANCQLKSASGYFSIFVCR